jgi:hypothetical protein
MAFNFWRIVFPAQAFASASGLIGGNPDIGAKFAIVSREQFDPCRTVFD